MARTIDWTRGYPTSEAYPSAWHYFQSPAYLRAICALCGVVWEAGPDEPVTVAELGCGSGYTACNIAAGMPEGRVIGIDYNPAHIAQARSMARAAGLTNVEFHECDLANLDASGVELPEFDLVCAHGVWSWVSDPVRDGILQILRRRLKPGGLAFVSYNALPGAAVGLALARIARKSILRASGSLDGIAQARDMVQRLIAAQARHIAPSGWLNAMLDGDGRSNYLLHEFLTEHWRPAFFEDVADALGSAGCEFVGSATIDENFPHMTLTDAQRAIWEEAPDDASRELINDACVSRAFRRDVYVRGLRRTGRESAVDALWVGATTTTPNRVLRTQAGEATLPDRILEPARIALAQGPATIGALRAMMPAGNTLTASELLCMLVGSSSAVPLWRSPDGDDGWDALAAPARRLNAVAAETLAPYGYGRGMFGLASPALAGAVSVSALELAVSRILAAADGQELEPRSIVAQLLPSDSSLPDDIHQSLQERVAEIMTVHVPAWRRLGIL